MTDNIDKDIQKTVLGCILHSSTSAMSACISVGCEESWFTGLNCKIWGVMYELFSSGDHLDVLTVGAKLKGVVRPIYLDDCIDVAHVPSKIKSYALMLRAQHKLKSAVILAQTNMAQLENVSWDEADDVVSSVQTSWNNLQAPSTEDDDIVTIGRKQIERWRQTKKTQGTIYWPLGVIANNLPPLTDELIIIAAKQSIGKTAMVIQWLSQLADMGTLTSFCSLESKKARLWPRFVSHRKQMNMRPLTRGEAPDEAYAAADAGLVELGDLPIRISDNGMNTDQLKAWGQTEKAAGSKMLVIDNMRHIRPVGKGRGLVEQYQEISLAVKWLRDDTNLPTVLLHHLTEDSKSGKLSTAWGTDIQKDADILVYLVENSDHDCKEVRDNGPVNITGIDFEIRKDRDGVKETTIALAFHPEIQTFTAYNEFDMEGLSLED